MKIQYKNLTIRQAEVADAKQLAASGADLLMTDYPDRIRNALYG